MNPTVGEQLRSAREAKHLSLEQAAQSTFIKIRFLEALENDRLDEMHTSTQARGFLRMYSELLGLPVGPLLDIWDGIEPVEEILPDGEAEITALTKGIESSATSDEPGTFVPDGTSLPAPVPEETEPVSTAGNSAEVFQEIGRVLKKRREDLRITHEDVEKFVHIRPKYLQALEEGQLDDLPSTVQGRGMLTNYAHFLEVDNARLQIRFAEGLQQRRLEINPPVPASTDRKTAFRPAKPAPPQDGSLRQPSFLKRVVTPDLMIAVPLIIFLLGFSFWALYEVVTRNSAVQEIQAPDISSVLLETSVPVTLLAEEATVEATSALAQEATQQASTQQEGAEAAATAPVEGNMPLNINIVARQNAWLKVTVGKSVVFNGRVVPGNAYPFSGNERVEFITGNAAALQVFYNGTDLGSLGLNGQVASMIFTLNGIITPTPQFSPTPAATTQATVTRQPTATQVPATVTPLIPLQ
ncbi:MAG: helix-turn-helix domain-containing protein [Anaerolineaceae bacterium]